MLAQMRKLGRINQASEENFCLYQELPEFVVGLLLLLPLESEMHQDHIWADLSKSCQITKTNYSTFFLQIFIFSLTLRAFLALPSIP